ncbi:SNW domain-containing protein 1 [Babesia caballi]|uniref:SNW domain-containing protein 1 n=1 Tax=Babesia caballi TaxID=5871 RepID=A0AAV4LUI2_BABCB|nr:SNW domain-containing protein 1 [Babesia caballi]
MFCPAIMLSSHLVTGTIAVLASTLVVPSNESDSGRRRAGRALQRLLLALAIFCLEDLILSLTTRHDGHIVQILLSTLKLSNPTFDSQIYMLGSEFRPLSIHVIHRILPTRLFQYAAVALLVLSILTYKGDRSTSGFRRSFNRYLGLQILVFVCMALAVSRLRVLALPLLCVFAGYTTLVLRMQPFKQSRVASVLAVALTMAPYMTTLPLQEMRVPPFGELYNSQDLKDVVSWVNRHVEPGTPILSDMPTSSALRAATRSRIVLNPQFEYAPLRRKTHFFYTLGDCNDARWFGDKMAEWYKTDLVIVPVKFCAIPRGGGPYGVQLLLSLNPLGTCPSSTPYHRRLCNRLWAGDPHFELLFSNARYLAFRYRGPPETAYEPPWETMHQLDHYKPWIKNHALADRELGPRQLISTARALKDHFNSPVVRPLLRYGLEAFEGNELMLRLYAETVDYDFARFEEARKLYKRLFALMDSRCESPDDLAFYAVYLSHMVDTGSGDAPELLSVIEASAKCLKLRFPRLSAQELCEHAVAVHAVSRDRLGALEPRVRHTAVRFFRLSQAANVVQFYYQFTHKYHKINIAAGRTMADYTRKSNYALLQSQRELLSGDSGHAGSFSLQEELAVPNGTRESSRTLALRYGPDGRPEFDAVVREGVRAGKIVYSKPGDQREKHFSQDALARPSDDRVNANLDRTREALDMALTRRRQNNAVSTGSRSEPEIFRYTPSQQSSKTINQRLIKMVEKETDPLEPSRYRNKKLPAAAPSPPPPLQHSPPRKLTKEDQLAWKVPPCISNWKNSKGYTIPIDKRVQADGRRLQEVYVNEKFAVLAESMALAERTAREEVRLRNEAHRMEKIREAQEKEEQLRALAARAREERSRLDVHGELQAAEFERKREIEREMRLERAGKKIKAAAARDRDISERVALGQPVPSKVPDSHDTRLLNTAAGLDSGFDAGEDETYNVYDKPLFADRSIVGIYQHSNERFQQSLGANEAARVPSFANAAQVQRTTPVEFVKETSDPFGLGSLLDKAKKEA